MVKNVVRMFGRPTTVVDEVKGMEFRLLPLNLLTPLHNNGNKYQTNSWKSIKIILYE